LNEDPRVGSIVKAKKNGFQGIRNGKDPFRIYRAIENFVSLPLSLPLPRTFHALIIHTEGFTKRRHAYLCISFSLMK